MAAMHGEASARAAGVRKHARVCVFVRRAAKRGMCGCSAEEARHELELAQQYDFITIADWAQVAQDNPDIWAGTDYVHFGSDSDSINRGGTLYAQMVKDAVDKANQGHVKP